MVITSNKFDFALNSIQERKGYCLVESETEKTPHVVTINEHLYNTSCTCKAGKRGVDCYHRLAVDRYYDAYRPSFYQMLGLEQEQETDLEPMIEQAQEEQQVAFPAATPEHTSKTEKVIEKLVGPTKPVITKKDAMNAPLNGNRKDLPTLGVTQYQAPRQLASIPMR
jgi:hypothetical protein